MKPPNNHSSSPVPGDRIGNLRPHDVSVAGPQARPAQPRVAQARPERDDFYQPRQPGGRTSPRAWQGQPAELSRAGAQVGAAPRGDFRGRRQPAERISRRDSDAESRHPRRPQARRRNPRPRHLFARLSLAIASPLIMVVLAGAVLPSNAVPSEAAKRPAQPAVEPALVAPAKPAGSGTPVVATRVVIPVLGIDLPIVSGDLKIQGNPPRYPLCDVAEYLTSFKQPGEGGTTYLFAHARQGMFLPLLQGSLRDDGTAMRGALVEVYTNGPNTYVYQISEVKRHAVDLSLARDIKPGEERLILQTSEGPSGTVPKLQVAARLVETRASPEGTNVPVPRPRVCAPPPA